MTFKMMKRALLFIMAVIMLGTPLSLKAVFDKGGVKGVGARPMGMGGAFTAIANDSNAIFWNPAGMVQVPKMELSGFLAPMLNGKQYYFAGAFTLPFIEQTAMGFSIESLSFNNENPSSENIYTFSFATPLNIERTVSLGLNLKFLQVNSGIEIDGIAYKAGAVGLDMGFLYQLPLPKFGKKLSFGFFAQDLDTVLLWDSGVEERVPMLISLGAAYWIEENLTVSVDYSFFDDQNISGKQLDQVVYDSLGNPIQSLEPQEHRPHVGIEGWFFNDHLGLRAGYSGFATTADRFTGGVSYKQESYGIDYAYMGHAEHLGDTHRLSAHYAFGQDSEQARVVSLVNPPTNIAARPANNSIHLAWSPNPDPHVTGYTIYMSKAPGGNYVPIQKRVKDTKVIIDGLTNGTRYYFVVTSVNNSWPAVESAYSREVSGVPAPFVPDAPALGEEKEDLGPAKNGVIIVKGWPVPTGNIKGYNLYISSVSGSGYKKINAEIISDQSFMVRDLEVNKRFYFVLTQLTSDSPPVESRPSQEWSLISVPETKLPASTPGLNK